MFIPSHYRIIAIGKVRKTWIQEGLNLYLKRLPGLSITELRDNNPTKEFQAINTSIKRGEILIALSEEGEAFSSLDFCNHLQKLSSQRIVFAIGGPNGLPPQTKAIAHSCVSLSLLTFPHEIARLLLVEQLYRASTILSGKPYHKA